MGEAVIGFQDDDESEQAPATLDGKHESKDSPEKQADAFVDLCQRLIVLGASYVRHGELRARFGRKE